MIKNLVFLLTRHELQWALGRAERGLPNYDVRTIQNPYNNRSKLGKDFHQKPLEGEEYRKKLTTHLQTSKLIKENLSAPVLLGTPELREILRDNGLQGPIIIYEPSIANYDENTFIETDIYAGIERIKRL